MLNIEAKVFSKIISEFSSTILTEYGMTVDDNFSTEGTSNTDAVFPFVYIHLLPGVEVGQTLENDIIEGGQFTIQIDVTDSSSPTTSKVIMDECVQIMKAMRFSVTQMPEFNYGSEYRQIARFRRVVSKDEEL